MKKQQIKKIMTFVLFLLVVISFTILICETADARAGGGQKYSGGGSSSRSSSSSRGSRSGGGSGDLIFFLIRLIFYYPAIGIPVTIVVIFFVARGYMAGDDAYVTYTISKGNRVRPQVNSRAALEKLKMRDPEFNEQIFKTRVSKGFEKIQQAWSKRDLAEAQFFLSDGIFEQFSIQIAEMKEKGLIDHMENLSIISVLPVNFQSDKNFDVIHVKISARAINYRKDEKTGKILDGSRAPEEFSEVWSFLRKPGVRTLQKPGLIEGQCPNCGNPIKIGRLAKCDVCNSLLRSGEFDWVLAEITQACEWAVSSEKFIPGFKDLVAVDSGFNIQHIEDRVSVMFWRKIEAERKADVNLLRKIAKNDYCDLLAKAIKPDESGRRTFYGDCAVGSVELIGVEMSEPEDKLFVEVRWSGYATSVGSDKKLDMARMPTNFRNIFVLSRKSGGSTGVGNSLSSSHCPSCGAPEQTGVENECAYCGAVMNDGKKEWVLSDILSHNDPVVQNVLRNISSMIKAEKNLGAGAVNKENDSQEDLSISGLELLKWTVAMMLADGEIDPKEMELITGIARQSSVPKDKLNGIIAEFKDASDPVAKVLEEGSLENGKGIMKQLARVALADGKLAKEEIAMLKNVGGKIGFVEADIDMMLKKERKNLYQEAKDALRKAKS